LFINISALPDIIGSGKIKEIKTNRVFYESSCLGCGDLGSYRSILPEKETGQKT
jgi:hypothetical protein